MLTSSGISKDITLTRETITFIIDYEGGKITREGNEALDSIAILEGICKHMCACKKGLFESYVARGIQPYEIQNEISKIEVSIKENLWLFMNIFAVCMMIRLLLLPTLR